MQMPQSCHRRHPASVIMIWIGHGTLSPQGNWREKHFTYTTQDGNVIAETIVKGRFSGVVNFVTGPRVC